MKEYYKPIFTKILERSVDATLSTLEVKNKALRNHIEDILSNNKIQNNRIIGDPVFEASFPWSEIENDFEKLGKENFLDPDFIESLNTQHTSVKYYNGAEKDLSNQTLKKNWKPRTHQFKSWEILKNKDCKSLIVTSGTGSGKTECFMIPIIDDLVRQYKTEKQKLEGVQALFVYPLNALINSQRERILSWTLNFNENIRFCLYNGNTPEKAKTQNYINGSPKNEIYDRTNLWSSPPPILITNPTMLEYMLIRNKDRPILDKSKGKLKYIVLDEAHTYIGSQAAELALLIRRVLNGFGVNAKDVRFIATSATIGNDPNSEKALKKYLSDISGIQENSIEVVTGSRTIPRLQLQNENNHNYQDLIKKDISLNKNEFYQNKTLRKLRSFFITTSNQQSKAKSLTQITDLIYPQKSNDIEYQIKTLQWIDLASSSELNKDNIPFLPLRGHFFHQVISGLWACISNDCGKKSKWLKKDWPYGEVFTQQRLTCTCGAPVLELVFCTDCNAPHLKAEIKNNNGVRKLSQVKTLNSDEFEVDTETSEEDAEIQPIQSNIECLIYSMPLPNLNEERTNNQGIIGIDPIKYPLKFNYNNQDDSCSNCGFAGQGTQKSMRGAYLGMPFYTSNMVPTLLEFVKDGSNPTNSPFRGRNLLTFTDSRQGTAKIAIKIQQESEKIRTRGLIYRALLESYDWNQINSSTNLLENARQQPQTPFILDLIAREEENLKNLKDNPITYYDLKTKLSNSIDIRDHITNYYNKLDSTLTSDQVTEILLAREFIRRPKRANSLETLGLVRTYYPQIDNIDNFPAELKQYNLDLTNWREFLNICLDFFIRDGVFVTITENSINWLGGKIRPKYLFSPHGNRNNQPRFKIWPQYNLNSSRQNKLIRILAQGLGLDLKIITDGQISKLNTILQSAWINLTNNGLLKSTDNENFQLDLSNISFKLVKQAWVCPITNKFLDKTFNGFTPYLPHNAKVNHYKCEQSVELVHPQPFIAQDDESYRAKIRDWINNDSSIEALKKKGLWHEQSTRILEGGNYIRSVEHSAQIRPQFKLEEYENDFKIGKINVLNCSTTMEMGVDIGGLSIICNNNVPPHPSNYLQRAGRAGRRGETRSLSMTICKNNAHDQQVFQNPLWAFETILKKPKITLESERIVRRHIQAYLFGTFLNKLNVQEETISLRADWFFEGKPSKNEQFTNWLTTIMHDCPKELNLGINNISNKSVLEGTNFFNIFSYAIDSLLNIQEKWQSQLNYYNNELMSINNQNINGNSSYLNRINADLDIHRKTYLISILITNGFLPGYGFPTNIATFNNYTQSDFNRPINGNVHSGREDNFTLYNNKPSRNISIALGEYSPGSQIVIDGKVYTSRGITLNFQNPDDNIRSHQLIHLAWKCKSCGKSGISHFGGVQLCDNPDCVNKSNIEFFEYIEPSGFATSFYEKPTNDISSQNYTPSQRPWININTELKFLINPSIGCYFSDTEGEIFYHNKGLNEQGFALCFKCGFAQSLDINGDIPQNFNNHYKLRGKNDLRDYKCNPSDNLIRKISLGFSDRTDVFELYLRTSDSGEYFLTRKEENKSLSYSLAVAMRFGLTKTLGINTEEIGIIVKQVVNQKLSNSPIYAICFYDINSGGSGFSTLANNTEIFRSMLLYAREFLNCTCNDACQKCLLQFDTKEIVDFLDRNIALSYLTDKLLNAFTLPENEKILGSSSMFCEYPIFDELKLNSREQGKKVQLFIGGDLNNWNIPDSSIRNHLYELVGPIGKFTNLELCIDSQSFSQLTERQKLELFFILIIYPKNISLIKYDETQKVNNILAIAYFNKTTTTYATMDNESKLFNKDWGHTEKNILVKADNKKWNFVGKKIHENDLFPKSDKLIKTTDSLNGSLKSFGISFWNLVNSQLNNLPTDFGNVKLIDYQDRYLLNPLTNLLLSRIISAIPFNKGTNFDIVISSWKNKNENRFLNSTNRHLHHNWHEEENESRLEFMKAILKTNGNQPQINLGENIPHSRELTIEFDNNKSLTIIFDQGMGYWKTNNKLNFPFYNDLEYQLNWVDSNLNNIYIMNRERHQTNFTISLNQ